METPDWVKTAKAGDRIVCIDRIEAINGESVPSIGSVYTIREILCEIEWIFFRLVEIENKPLPYRDGTCECAFNAVTFRPVQPRATDISVFTRLLNTAPSEMEDA